MAAKLVIRVYPDDRVQVEVEGLDDPRKDAPPGEKLCEKLTRKLEDDLGQVLERTYEQDSQRQEQFETDSEARKQDLGRG